MFSICLGQHLPVGWVFDFILRVCELISQRVLLTLVRPAFFLSDFSYHALFLGACGIDFLWLCLIRSSMGGLLFRTMYGLVMELCSLLDNSVIFGGVLVMWLFA